jgi:hypothetical protein
MSEVESKERIAALEAEIAELKAAYHDVAFEYQDNLIKRVEDIRTELTAVLTKIYEHVDSTTSETAVKASAAIEEASQKLTRESIADAVVKAVVVELTSGKYVLPVRHATRTEVHSATAVKLV